jgi:predicted dinucleotide-binding enzyme
MLDWRAIPTPPEQIVMSFADRAGCSRRAILAALVLAIPFGGALAQTGTPLKIGIVGSGRLGGTVGGLWAKAGHKVFFSSRHPDELKPLIEKIGANAQAGTVEQAIAFGGVILIAVPYSALPAVGRDNAKGLAGKVVLNASNPIYPRDGDVAKAAQEKGVGEADRDHLPGTRLVRAFNSTGSGKFASESNRPGEKIGVAIASDDAGAMKVAAQLVRDAGFEPVEVPLARAKEFAPPAPLFGKALPVSELRKALGVTQ